MLRLVLIALLVFVLWRLFSSLGTRQISGGPSEGRTPTQRPSPWEVLGVQPGASAAEIRAAYQAKVRQYHPDQVANLGPELRDLAEQRTKEINAAYEALRGRG